MIISSVLLGGPSFFNTPECVEISRGFKKILSGQPLWLMVRWQTLQSPTCPERIDVSSHWISVLASPCPSQIDVSKRWRICGLQIRSISISAPLNPATRLLLKRSYFAPSIGTLYVLVTSSSPAVSLGAEGVLPSRHIESFLRVFKQLTHNLPSRQVVSYLSICPPL